jgi:hypothetical protein
MDWTASWSNHFYRTTNDTDSTTVAEHKGGAEAAYFGEFANQIIAASSPCDAVPALHFYHLRNCGHKSDEWEALLAMSVYKRTH